MKIGCVVMAAGNAERFGANKLLEELEGKPLIVRALEAAPPEAETVVVTQYPEIARLAAEFGFRCVINDRPELGISRTVRLGTEALSNCDGILYQVSDQPRLRRQTVGKLLSFWKEQPDCIAALCQNGKRGNPCLFPRRFFGELCLLEGDRGGSAVICRHPEALRLLEAPAEELTDTDTQSELDKLRG